LERVEQALGVSSAGGRNPAPAQAAGDRSSAGMPGPASPPASPREPVHRLAGAGGAGASLVELSDIERNHHEPVAPMSPPVTVAPSEQITALIRERMSVAREHSPKVTIGRLDIRVINQSSQKQSESIRKPAGDTGSENFDSIGRRLLGRFDLV